MFFLKNHPVSLLTFYSFNLFDLVFRSNFRIITLFIILTFPILCGENIKLLLKTSQTLVKISFVDFLFISHLYLISILYSKSRLQNIGQRSANLNSVGERSEDSSNSDPLNLTLKKGMLWSQRKRLFSR